MAEPRLPKLLAEIEALTSRRVALQLVADFGGTKIYIQKHPKPGQPLVESVGMAAALTIAAAYGGDHAEIPLAAALGYKKHAIARAVGTVNRIAREAGVTERYVRQVRNRRSDPRQRRLFGTD